MSMGIYIRGMEMPTDGRLFAIVINSATGEIMRPSGDGGWAVVDGTRAVQLPPHGRLIDADILPKFTGYALSADAIAEAVSTAPTIIPAEEGEE